jgi:cyclic pyranopterin phosphate synthase
MTKRVIPISLQSNPRPRQNYADAPTTSGVLIDTLHRPLRDLRISVTDRCNFRCVYCMPRHIFDQHYSFLPQHALLTFEEITRVAQLLVAQGVTKIRLTGGEPLLRKNIERLVAMLRQLTTPDQTPLELTLTTNGALLAQKAKLLKEAGLDRVTVSLDALDEATFKRVNDTDFSVKEILHGIEVARQVGLDPIKINMVVKAGINEDQIVPMARHFKNSSCILRFIEYMDVGSTNSWKANQVISSQTIVDQINQAFGSAPQLIPIPSNYRGETAQRWKYSDGVGEIGIVASVTHAFCHDCTRLRLATDGKVYTCLFTSHGHDIRDLLRGNVDDEQLAQVLAQIWTIRSDRYSELRGPQNTSQHKVEMSYIGG